MSDICHTCEAEIPDWQAKKWRTGIGGDYVEHNFFEDCIRNKPELKAKRVDIWVGHDEYPTYGGYTK